MTFHGVADITCQKSTFAGSIQSHGPGVTAKGPINSLSLTECNQHVIVIKNGTLELHALGNGDAGIKWSNGEVTTELTTIFGTVHCVLGTSNTPIGTITGAASSTSHAVLDIDSSPIPVKSGSFLCGSSVEWTGRYRFTSPTGLSFS